jgi:PIN domain nuclease of toxin-antitoxin system
MILLDTHVLLWMSVDPKKLSKKARAAILDARANDGIAVASITLWELAWLAENGRVQVSGTVEAFVRGCVSKVIIYPITPEIAVHAVQLPSDYPKDPQDRLIGATARVEGLPLVTADSDILASKAVPTIW